MLQDLLVPSQPQLLAPVIRALPALQACFIGMSWHTDERPKCWDYDEVCCCIAQNHGGTHAFSASL